MERKEIIENIKKRDIESDAKTKQVVGLLLQGNIDGAGELVGGKENLKVDKYNIFTFINNFTSSDKTAEEKMDNIKKLYFGGYVRAAGIGPNSAELTTLEGVKMNIDVLSHALPSFTNDKTLKTLERQGKCHEKSLNILREYANEGIKVVTADISPLSDEIKHLHSWVEINLDGKDYCIDYTMNALINKDGYYAFMNPEVRSVLTREEYMKDLEVLTPLLEKNSVDIKEYLVYPKEVVAEIVDERQ